MVVRGDWGKREWKGKRAAEERKVMVFKEYKLIMSSKQPQQSNAQYNEYRQEYVL